MCLARGRDSCAGLLPVVAIDDALRVQWYPPRSHAVLARETNSIAVENDLDGSGISNTQLQAAHVRNAVGIAGPKNTVDENVLTASLYGDPDRAVHAQCDARIPVLLAVALSQWKRRMKPRRRFGDRRDGLRWGGVS